MLKKGDRVTVKANGKTGAVANNPRPNGGSVLVNHSDGTFTFAPAHKLERLA